MSEFTFLLEELGDWLQIRAEVAADLSSCTDPFMQLALNFEIMNIDSQIVEIRDRLDDMENDFSYGDYYTPMLSVVDDHVDEWDNTHSWEPMSPVQKPFWMRTHAA